MLKKKEPPVFFIQTTSNKLVLFEINVNWHRKTKIRIFFKKEKFNIVLKSLLVCDKFFL